MHVHPHMCGMMPQHSTEVEAMLQKVVPQALLDSPHKIRVVTPLLYSETAMQRIPHTPSTLLASL